MAAVTPAEALETPAGAAEGAPVQSPIEEFAPVEIVVPPPAQVVEESLTPQEYGYCLYCGRRLEEAYHFCPGCGQDAQALRHCSRCDQPQYIPPGTQPVYCVHCGQEMI